MSIRKTIAQFLRKKAKFFFSWRYIFARKNCILRIHSQTSFRAKLRCFTLLRYYVLRNFAKQMFSKMLKKSVNCINELSMTLHFFAYNCNDYFHNTLFCNLMHDGTLQIKMCTISNKISSSILPIN